MLINVVMLRRNGTTVTFQSDSWNSAVASARRSLADPFYNGVGISRIFMAADDGSEMHEYSPAEIRDGQNWSPRRVSPYETRKTLREATLAAGRKDLKR